MKDKAIEKLRHEAKELKGLSRCAAAVKDAAVEALCSFCSQSEEFAAAVLDGGKALAGALEASVKGCGNSISDLEVFRRAAGYYFTGSTVEFNMKIYMSKYDIDKKPEGAISLSLDELI